MQGLKDKNLLILKMFCEYLRQKNVHFCVDSCYFSKVRLLIMALLPKVYTVLMKCRSKDKLHISYRFDKVFKTKNSLGFFNNLTSFCCVAIISLCSLYKKEEKSGV